MRQFKLTFTFSFVSAALLLFIINCSGNMLDPDPNKVLAAAKKDYIPRDQIDDVVNQIIEHTAKSYVRIGEQQYEVIAAANQGEGSLAVFFSDKLLLINNAEESIKAKRAQEVFLISGVSERERELQNIEGNKEAAQVTLNTFESRIQDIMFGSGTVDGQKIEMSVSIHLTGYGSSRLRISGDTVYLNGDLGTLAYIQFRDLLRTNKGIQTIVLEQVPGSINDAINVHTAYMIRDAKLTTKLLKNSSISSGGVDFFIGGFKRIMENGAKIGVHSWQSGDGTEGADLAKDHPAHRQQLEFFETALGKEDGPLFYWFTLQAAPAADIYDMKNEEILKYKLLTEPIL